MKRARESSSTWSLPAFVGKKIEKKIGCGDHPYTSDLLVGFTYSSSVASVCVYAISADRPADQPTTQAAGCNMHGRCLRSHIDAV
jgi:hypothetical protein